MTLEIIRVELSCNNVSKNLRVFYRHAYHCIGKLDGIREGVYELFLLLWKRIPDDGWSSSLVGRAIDVIHRWRCESVGIQRGPDYNELGNMTSRMGAYTV